MDADGLPLVGPGIDYTKVEAINQKRTIAFLNHFISHTASFLNRFSTVCEEKLEQMSNRLQQLEITMNLLDAKISSIPGLENVTAPASSTAAPADTAATMTTTTTPGAPPPPPPAQGDQQPTPAPAEAEPAPVEEVKNENPVSKDPRYMKFFKMLQFGVPNSAVKLKMKTEGLNTDFLDTPDAPAPPGGGTKDDDDDDFSDNSDEEEEDSDFD